MVKLIDDPAAGSTVPSYSYNAVAGDAGQLAFVAVGNSSSFAGIVDTY